MVSAALDGFWRGGSAFRGMEGFPDDLQPQQCPMRSQTLTTETGAVQALLFSVSGMGHQESVQKPLIGIQWVEGHTKQRIRERGLYSSQ